MAKTLISVVFISYITLLSILRCKCEPLPINVSNPDGFTTDLIHRDSPDSPLYDPSLTPSQRLAAARQRSRRFSSKATAAAPISDARGEYLMQFFMGTPIKPAALSIDTGSDIIWTQCTPCRRCARTRYPVFNPGNSSTYRELRCASRGCGALAPSSECDRRSQKCLYSVEYKDHSYSKGPVAEDTFVFRTSTNRGLVTFPRIVFGCGHDNHFHTPSPGSGIMGLGDGNASLVEQLGYKKFSYCLVPTGDHNKTGKLHFGANAAVSGAGAVSTPLAAGDLPVYYYLTLVAISVGNKRIEYRNGAAAAGRGGNIIIDSGATVTALPVRFYYEVEAAIANSIGQRAVRDFEEWRLCYTAAFEMPRIIVHFEGADVEWRRYNAFVRVTEDYECLAVEPIGGADEQAIYGNIAQANYLVGYDLTRRSVSFKQTQCA